MNDAYDFPCDNCICVPVCRHKPYSNLITDCALLANYINANTEEINGTLYIPIRIMDRDGAYFRNLLQSYLHPTAWEVNAEGFFISYSKGRQESTKHV